MVATGDTFSGLFVNILSIHRMLMYPSRAHSQLNQVCRVMLLLVYLIYCSIAGRWRDARQQCRLPGQMPGRRLVRERYRYRCLCLQGSYNLARLMRACRSHQSSPTIISRSTNLPSVTVCIECISATTHGPLTRLV